MSGFLLVANSDPRTDEDASGRLRFALAIFERKRMRCVERLAACGHALYLFSNESCDPAGVLSRDGRGRYCTYVGTFVYRGVTGCAATAAVLEQLDSKDERFFDEAIGNYCLLIHDGRELRIATDRAGLHHVYHDDRLAFVSNSFLAMSAIAPARTLLRQEVLEFVQLGATFGPSTLLKEVRLLESEAEVRIGAGGGRLLRMESVWERPVGEQGLAVNDMIGSTLEACDRYYRQISRAFSNKVTAALSGGYDSRLNLALLRRHEVVPKLFVYGKSTDSDVRVAKMICDGEGLKLTHLDRGAVPPMKPEAYWLNQEDVFHGLDGLTQYGFACEPFEVSHRRERVAGGLLAVNGGGGEIWRDFWKLPRKRMRASEFVRGYFGGRLGGFREGGEEQSFLDGLAEKVRAITGSGERRMSLEVIQSLYARLRLRYWQGKNNSVDNHVGLAVTPFSEHHFSVPAMRIPARARKDGWFESQLLMRASPRLAGYMSSYGHDFATGPKATDRLKSAITIRLPVALRILHRRSRNDPQRFYFHDERYLRARFGARPLEVEQYVSTADLRDALAFSRALTVERMLRGEWT
jgi:hypothetical protein